MRSYGADGGADWLKAQLTSLVLKLAHGYLLWVLDFSSSVKHIVNSGHNLVIESEKINWQLSRTMVLLSRFETVYKR